MTKQHSNDNKESGINNIERDFNKAVSDFLDENPKVKTLFQGIIDGKSKKNCTEEDAKKVQDFIGGLGVKMGIYKDKNDIWEK